MGANEFSNLPLQLFKACDKGVVLVMTPTRPAPFWLSFHAGMLPQTRTNVNPG